MSYISMIVLCTVIGLIAQWSVNHQIKKYSSVASSFSFSGAQMGQRMLAGNGISGVPFRQGGEGQDHFDPRDNSITLDTHAFSYNSITALATACHEAGHACQYAEKYAPMRFRSALVPVVNLASSTWMIALLAGIFLHLTGLVNVAIVLFSFAVLFQLVTLPVEFNASRRALNFLKTTGMPSEELAGASKVLTACAFTYVAAALVSILQLLWLLGSARD